jgi:DNA-binding transcriptional LysR family regulator
MSMDIRQLARIDLNLLIALQVLLEERNVSRAAQRLFITQPAMSKTLGRLRDVFADPLFIRASHGVTPTPKALAMAQPLREVLESVGKLVLHAEFDPASYRGEFVIASTETLGVVILAPLMQELAVEAPGVSLRTVNLYDHQLEQLADGGIDFSIHLSHMRYADEYDVQTLAGSKPVAVVRNDHPLIEQTIDWPALVAYPFIDFHVPDTDQTAIMQRDKLLVAGFVEPTYAFSTAHLLTALAVVRRTDYVLLLPSFVVHNPLVRTSLTVLPLPTDMEFEYMLVSHRRIATSAPHQWLRKKLVGVVSRFEPKGGV